MALTDLPTDLADGEYSLTIDHVQRTWENDTITETVVAELSPLRATTSRSVTTPVDGDRFPGQVTEGEVYRARVRDGEFANLHRDWERGVRKAANQVNEELALPLKSSREHVPGTLESPSLATVARNKSLLVTGEPGAGKTEAIKLLLNQIQADDDTPMVLFSFKDDYTEWAENRNDVVKLSTRDASHVYNIFEEIDPTGPKGEDEFDEMADVLFKEHRAHSKNVFFPDAASTLLGGLLRYLYREGKCAGLCPDNRELLDFIRRFDQKEAYELLSATDEDGNPTYPDLQGAAGTITPNARKQTAGVYTTLRLILRRTFGTGDLGLPAARGETISIREYMENPQGRILLLDFPIAEAERVKPAFRFFLHRAIKFGLKDRGQAYYVLDEFARIPDVTNMEELVDTGRAQNAQAILGLQSVSQLDAKYGRHVGKALRSGMLYELHLRSGDRHTVDYVRHRLGGDTRVTDYLREGVEDSSHPPQTTRTITGEKLTPVLQQLDDGEGFLVTPGGHAHVSLPMYADLSPETRRALGAGEETGDRSLDGTTFER
jgi:hypothetical protein